MKILLIIIICAYGSMHAIGQELNAQFKVNAPKLQTTDPRVFKSLEDDARKFISTRLWTNDKFQLHERIKCNFTLNIRTEENSTSFTGDLIVTASRPVFGSNYETTLINFQDRDVKINYEPNQPLDYVQNAFTNRLTAILAFYSNLIIGLDYDSFSPNGGNDYFLICQNIINTIPSTMVKEGWKPDDNARNRYWALESIMNPRLRTMRSAWYSYHRQGMDLMHQNQEEGRRAMARALESIDISKRNYPAAMWIQLFTDAKTKEIVEVFKKADKPQQQSVYNILSRLDPAAASKYQPLAQ